MRTHDLSVSVSTKTGELNAALINTDSQKISLHIDNIDMLKDAVEDIKAFIEKFTELLDD